MPTNFGEDFVKTEFDFIAKVQSAERVRMGKNGTDPLNRP